MVLLNKVLLMLTKSVNYKMKWEISFCKTEQTHTHRQETNWKKNLNTWVEKHNTCSCVYPEPDDESVICYGATAVPHSTDLEAHPHPFTLRYTDIYTTTEMVFCECVRSLKLSLKVFLTHKNSQLHMSYIFSKGPVKELFKPTETSMQQN